MDPDDTSGDEGRILSPKELELEDKDGVEEIDEGRFVVSADGTDPELPTELSVEGGEPVGEDSVDEERSARAEIDREAVRNWCEEQLEANACEYGFHVSMKAGDAVQHHALHSDDVTMAFNDLLLWWARTVDRDLPPGVVIGILLSDASVPVRYPTKALEEFLLAQGLSTEDTIGDLLAAVREDEEVVFPPRRG